VPALTGRPDGIWLAFTSQPADSPASTLHFLYFLSISQTSQHEAELLNTTAELLNTTKAELLDTTSNLKAELLNTLNTTSELAQTKHLSILDELH
jgi:hypothetical protein